MDASQISARDSLLLTIDLRLMLWIIGLYVLSCVAHIGQACVSAFCKNLTMGRIATWLLYAAAISHTGLTVLRWVEEGKPPFQNKYECLSWFAWSNVLTYIYVQRRWRRVSFPGVFVTVLSIAAMFIALHKYDPAVVPLAPALQSKWYIWHVLIAFFSYAVFVVGCSIELSYLFMRLSNWLGKSWEYFGLPASEVEPFHRLTFKLILVGFPLLTFGIGSGAAWADEAWGRYWSWDPFEILTLITWTAFALYLHAMAVPKWRNVLGSVFNVLGFACMIVTFMGSGWLTRLFGLYSMHAY
ncbi:MAG TPA: cytochrome c biogenesis protein CcsA [Candidatus Brocadiia bacterium]|nr:cytochrome c biogenesis protein CcsA [Planctomycetota bacterium]MDO8092564.1 cytochrome c biogenesis protein CcsA [Candidatus Brocadiales bacterium]